MAEKGRCLVAKRLPKSRQAYERCSSEINLYWELISKHVILSRGDVKELLASPSEGLFPI